jgi:signal transduction histidine kinase
VDGRQRTFLVNASGIVEGGHLIRIWGSCLERPGENGSDRHTVALLEAQQEHLGRELHDNVGQLLTAVRMMSSNLAAGYFDETDERSALARKVALFAEEASQNLRTLYHGLLPPAVHREGLAAALQRLAQQVDELPGLACHFVHGRQADVAGREEKLQLYRIAQEAVNNALKHAQAANVWIVLDRTAERLRVAVRDDGMGFEPEENATRSFGLSSMRYRARSIDADLIIEARPGEGTTVTCLL